MYRGRGAAAWAACVGLSLLSLLAGAPQTVSGDLADPPPQAADEAEVQALVKMQQLSQADGALKEWDFSKDPCGASDCRLAAYEGASVSPVSKYSNVGSPGLSGSGNGINATAAWPPCQFPGLSCEGWRVTELSLPGLGLDMEYLPPELADLSNLRSLDLSQNAIRGILSKQLLEGLAGLEVLVLSQNNLTGSLPVQLSVLGALQVLDLSRNQLDGFIPFTISGLTSLVVLDLGHNSLVGQMPYSLEALSGTLQELDVTGNCGICGAANATSSPDSIYTSLESLEIEGTHIWQSCANYNTFGCEESVSYFSLGVQIIVVVIFMILASMLACIVCSYIRSRHIFALLTHANQDRPPRAPPLGEAFDEAEQGHHGSHVGDLELKPRRGLPIEAVIINPGSTVLSPNICVAIIDSRELEPQRSAASASESPHQNSAGAEASPSDDPRPAAPSALGTHRSLPQVTVSGVRQADREYASALRWSFSRSARFPSDHTAPQVGPGGSLRERASRWLSSSALRRGQRGGQEGAEYPMSPSGSGELPATGET